MRTVHSVAALVRTALACSLLAFLPGCLTLPEIREDGSGRTIGAGYRVPEPACPEARAVRDGLVARMSTPAAPLPDSSPARLALAIKGDTQTEVGKIVAASMGADVLMRSMDGKNVGTISRKLLQEELRRAHEAAQEKAFTTSANQELALYERYFEAYFRKGRFITAGMNKGDATTRVGQDFRNALNIADGTQLPADQQKILDDAAKGLVNLVCPKEPCNLVTADEEAGFVNRAGTKFGFPVVTFVVRPGTAKGYELTKIDELQVVGDLTRVFWEATFDVIANDRKLKMPADSKATACTGKPWSGFDCIVPADENGQKRLGRMNLVADRTEGVAGYVAAQVVRGAFFLALDNEALAKLFQTTLSVSARKAAEIMVAVNERHCGTAEPSSYRTVNLKLAP